MVVSAAAMVVWPAWPGLITALNKARRRPMIDDEDDDEQPISLFSSAAMVAWPGMSTALTEARGQQTVIDEDEEEQPISFFSAAARVAAVNTWGAARDSELIQLRLVVAAHAGELGQLRGDVGLTQTVVASAFEQAKAALQAIVDNFRVEAAKLRYDGEVEATQSLSRLELVVGEARARFDTQDVRFADGLRELAQRFQAVDTWAQAEPARVAAIVQAAPAPPWGASVCAVARAPPPGACCERARISALSFATVAKVCRGRQDKGLYALAKLHS